MFGSAPCSDVTAINNWFGWDPTDFPRYRDATIKTTHPEVVILTRTGGGNREYYEDENDALTCLTGYKDDQDSSFDSTYAEWKYEIPKNKHGEWEKYVIDEIKTNAIQNALGWGINTKHSKIESIDYFNDCVKINGKNFTDNDTNVFKNLIGYESFEEVGTNTIFTYTISSVDKYNHALNLSEKYLFKCVVFSKVTGIPLSLILNVGVQVDIKLSETNAILFTINKPSNTFGKLNQRFESKFSDNNITMLGIKSFDPTSHYYTSWELSLKYFYNKYLVTDV
jgi:hypothetical protein